MSERTAHTPGPWEVARSLCGCYPVVRKNFRADHHMEVCGPVHGYMYSADEKSEQAANARLIAAAPEMFSEGRFLVERLDEFERELLDDEVARQFHGHVAPALARFRAALLKSQETTRGE